MSDADMAFFNTMWDDCLKGIDFAAKRTAENELWTIGEATGSLYNYGNDCYYEAVKKMMDYAKESAAKDGEVIDETTK